jgi:adenylate cyclase
MGTCDSRVVRDQLEKILASDGFTRNDRLSAFLRFVVEQELSGRGDQLKESVIGVEVFGREPDYDPRQDSVVRTEAAKLRARLAKYYEKSAGPLIIELPKGAYNPVFRESLSGQAAKQSGPRHRPLRPRTLWLAAIIGSLVFAFSALAWWTLHENAPIPIAVLPLINLSQDPANDYFTDGLTGEIIRNLSIIDGLAVRSTSSFAFKGKPGNVRDAGKQLDVDYIVEGSVLRAGQQLRINTQLIRVQDDFPLWSGKYEREDTDIFAIQDEISRGIVNSLRLKLGRAAGAMRPALRRTISTCAGAPSKSGPLCRA